ANSCRHPSCQSAFCHVYQMLQANSLYVPWLVAIWFTAYLLLPGDASAAGLSRLFAGMEYTRDKQGDLIMNYAHSIPNVKRTLHCDGRDYEIFSLAALKDAGFDSVEQLPVTLKILLENL